MKIHGIRRLSHQSHLNLFDIRYEDRRGRRKSWIMASRATPRTEPRRGPAAADAVIVVPLHTEHRKLVLIREFRLPLADYQYGFPAGLVDGDETIETAARRELHEETGLEMTRLLAVSPAVYSSAGMTDEAVALAFVECRGQATAQYAEASEEISVRLVSPGEAAALCADASLRFDAKAWLVLQAYACWGCLPLPADRAARDPATGG